MAIKPVTGLSSSTAASLLSSNLGVQSGTSLLGSGVSSSLASSLLSAKLLGAGAGLSTNPEHVLIRERILQFLKEKGTTTVNSVGDPALAGEANSLLKSSQNLESLKAALGIGQSSREQAITNGRAQALELYKKFGPGMKVTTRLDASGNPQQSEDPTAKLLALSKL